MIIVYIFCFNFKLPIFIINICVLYFNFELSVFAINIYVLCPSRMLRWLPLGIISSIYAFMYLNKRVLNKLKNRLY